MGSKACISHVCRCSLKEQATSDWSDLKNEVAEISIKLISIMIIIASRRHLCICFCFCFSSVHIRTSMQLWHKWGTASPNFTVLGSMLVTFFAFELRWSQNWPHDRYSRRRWQLENAVQDPYRGLRGKKGVPVTGPNRRYYASCIVDLDLKVNFRERSISLNLSFPLPEA